MSVHAPAALADVRDWVVRRVVADQGFRDEIMIGMVMRELEAEEGDRANLEASLAILMGDQASSKFTADLWGYLQALASGGGPALASYSSQEESEEGEEEEEDDDDDEYYSSEEGEEEYEEEEDVPPLPRAQPQQPPPSQAAPAPQRAELRADLAPTHSLPVPPPPPPAKLPNGPPPMGPSLLTPTDRLPGTRVHAERDESTSPCCPPGGSLLRYGAQLVASAVPPAERAARAARQWTRQRAELRRPGRGPGALAVRAAVCPAFKDAGGRRCGGRTAQWRACRRPGSWADGRRLDSKLRHLRGRMRRD